MSGYQAVVVYGVSERLGTVCSNIYSDSLIAQLSSDCTVADCVYVMKSVCCHSRYEFVLKIRRPQKNATLELDTDNQGVHIQSNGICQGHQSLMPPPSTA